MPFRLTHQALAEHVSKVDELSFAPLLRISCETDAGSEPLWLDFCDYLVNPAQVSSAPTLANDATYQWLRELAIDFWGNDEPSEPLDIVTLMLKLFALERTDQWGGSTTVLQCDRVAAHRALAVAELARQWWGKVSGRPRLSKPVLDPRDFLCPQ